MSMLGGCLCGKVRYECAEEAGGGPLVGPVLGPYLTKEEAEGKVK